MIGIVSFPRLNRNWSFFHSVGGLLTVNIDQSESLFTAWVAIRGFLILSIFRSKEKKCSLLLPIFVGKLPLHWRSRELLIAVPTSFPVKKWGILAGVPSGLNC